MGVYKALKYRITVHADPEVSVTVEADDMVECGDKFAALFGASDYWKLDASVRNFGLTMERLDEKNLCNAL